LQAPLGQAAGEGGDLESGELREAAPSEGGTAKIGGEALWQMLVANLAAGVRAEAGVEAKGCGSKAPGG
jgi:hypothetical protein